MLKEQADKMSVQELCDYAVEKLVQQGSRCVDISGCYSDGEGNHCAIGWLLDHTKTDWRDVRSSITTIVESCPTLYPALPNPIKLNSKIFQILQNFHDVSYKDSRERILDNLIRLGITPNENYYKWVNLGKEEYA